MNSPCLIDEDGRCSLHPAILLKHRKKNGEWRVLLNACPLCVSGLPATGQPVSKMPSKVPPNPAATSVPPTPEEPPLAVANDDGEKPTKPRKPREDGEKRRSRHRAPKKEKPQEPSEERKTRVTFEQVHPPPRPPPLQPPQHTAPLHPPGQPPQLQAAPHISRPLPPQQYTQQTPSHQPPQRRPAPQQPPHRNPNHQAPNRPARKQPPQRPNYPHTPDTRPDPEDDREFRSPTRPPRPPAQQQRFTAPPQKSRHEPIEQDEVSMMSMSSVGRNMAKAREEMIDEKDDSEDSESKPDETADETATEIRTAEFDSKGRCIRHPTVRLRKKKFLRGWQIMLSNCPECCLDEMRRVKDERAKQSAEARKKKKEDSLTPPITQVNVEKKSKKKDGDNLSGGGDDDSKSIGTASTITISSYTHSTNGPQGPWQNFAQNGPHQHPSLPRPPSENFSDGPARVTRMPYTDQYGENGWYTGEVDATTGTPHGRGTMNYSNGAVYEGEWRNGVSVSPSKTREEPLSSTTPKIHGHRPKQNMNHHHPPPGRPSGRVLETHFEDDGSIPVPPMSSMAEPPRKVVCGMPWSDGNGDTGSYTGEVNSLNIPDGMGSMRYDNGIVAEGSWVDGEIETDDTSREGAVYQSLPVGPRPITPAQGRFEPSHDMIRRSHVHDGGSVGSHGSKRSSQ